MVLVDSSVWIEASRRNGDVQVKVALESLLEEYEATVCGPIRLEVLGGARKEERKALSYFFDILPTVSGDETLWEAAKALSWRLRDKGFQATWNDLLIAALSIKKCCRVYSIDRHFQDLNMHCGVLLYEPSYGGSYNPE